MACGKTVFLLVTILASMTYVLTEEENASKENNRPNHRGREERLSHEEPAWAYGPRNHDDRAGFFGLPNLFNFGQLPTNPLLSFLGSNGSDPFSQFTNAFGQFFNSGSNSSGLFGLPQFGRSQQLGAPSDLENVEGNDTSLHDRFFFGILSNHFLHQNLNNRQPIGCNYTTQAGYSCAGCREQLLCSSNNVGSLRICPSSAPYCYNGVCGSYVNATCTNSTG